MKKLIFLIPVFLLTACDDVNISKYPESIQSCYNKIINTDGICVTRKKTILKYCQCCDAFESDIEAKKDELTHELYMQYQATSFVASGFGGLGYLWGARERNILMNEIRQKFTDYVDKIYDSCAEKTGYIREKNCNKKEKQPEEPVNKKDDNSTEKTEQSD